MIISHILVAAALVAIPVLLKYFLAFETRTLFENLRSQEEEVRRMSAHWQALERERLVMRRAIRQVATQKRHAATRRERLELMQRRIASDYVMPEAAYAELDTSTNSDEQAVVAERHDGGVQQRTPPKQRKQTAPRAQGTDFEPAFEPAGMRATALESETAAS